MSEQARVGVNGFALLELMGHRRMWGLVTEVEAFGVKMCRIDVPGPAAGEVKLTQWYGGSAIYCITPTTEEIAREKANPPEWRPTAYLGRPAIGTQAEGDPEHDPSDTDDDELTEEEMAEAPL